VANYTFTMHPGSTSSIILNLAAAVDGSVRIMKLRASTGSVTSRQFEYTREQESHHAVSHLITECGMDDLFSGLRREPVRVAWDGNIFIDDDAWTEAFAPGASAEKMNADAPELFVATMRKTKALDWFRAALFDTLTLQGDRHAEQVLITAEGAVRFIDTAHRAFNVPAGLNTVFSPGSYFYQRNSVGWEYLKNRSLPKILHHSPQLSWDFRCTQRDGVHLRAFNECRDRLVKMSTRAIADLYFGNPTLIMKAQALKRQARRLASGGLEHALRVTRHSNDSGLVPTPMGFPWQPPRCDVQFI
jgi:hypothetical protein